MEQRRMDMLLRQIEYLQAVIEMGSFYAAAQKCYVSQSAISQQIKKLEEELGVQLLDRHNRTFTLTPAGTHFYQKSLIITGDLQRLKRETKRIGNKNNSVLRIGYYKGYYGNELSQAIALFSEEHPTVDIQITVGSHEELYYSMEKEKIDLALNDQRRAFSNAYVNEVLSHSRTFIEISNKNPLSHLESIEVNDLKNTPCILVINPEAQKEEQQYYQDIVGIKGEFIFSQSIQEARLKIITGQGFMPVDVIGHQEWFDTTVSRIPLTRNHEEIQKTYCAFYRKENANPYIQEFAQLLKEQF